MQSYGRSFDWEFKAPQGERRSSQRFKDPCGANDAKLYAMRIRRQLEHIHEVSIVEGVDEWEKTKFWEVRITFKPPPDFRPLSRNPWEEYDYGRYVGKRRPKRIPKLPSPWMFAFGEFKREEADPLDELQEELLSWRRPRRRNGFYSAWRPTRRRFWNTPCNNWKKHRLTRYRPL